MPSITRALFLTVFSCAVLHMASLGSLAQAGAMRGVIVDMPHGGCRLHAGDDGSASLQFGATARTVRVLPGAFDFELLVGALREKAYRQPAGKPAGHSIGSVSLPQDEELLFIDDEHLVNALLKRAWDARVLPSTPMEIEADEWVAKACAFR